MAHLLGGENLHLEFPTKTVFDAVSLGIDEGDRIGIVGRNGDGKSTLMKLLAGRLKPDGGRVTVRSQLTLTEAGAPRSVRLVIKDNGPGFAEKVLKRAFEPYVTTKSKGTGLGLAVVKKIADEHGARVRLANLPGGDDTGQGIAGAQVSISFSKLAPADSPPAVLATA